MKDKSLPLQALVLLAGLAVIVLTGFTLQRPAQKWEYRWITVVRPAESNAEWVKWYDNTAEGRRELPPPISTISKAAELGDLGWELVAVTPVSNHTGGHVTEGYGSSDMAGYTSQLIYYFKRAR